MNRRSQKTLDISLSKTKKNRRIRALERLYEKRDLFDKDSSDYHKIEEEIEKLQKKLVRSKDPLRKSEVRGTNINYRGNPRRSPPLKRD